VAKEVALLTDIRSIMARLRARDAMELAAYGWDAELAASALAAPAELARVFAHEDRPAAVVAFHRLTPCTLAASMVATDDWTHVARRVVRWAVREARPTLLAKGYTRAECRTMAGHSDAIRLLEHLGFVLECRIPSFGAHDTTFLQYAWRLSDHVPLEGAASAAATATTAAA